MSLQQHMYTTTPACPLTSRPVPLCDTCRVTEQGFALLAGFLHLHSLWVDSCNLGTAVLMALACNPSLQLLEVHRSHPEAETLSMQQLQLLARVTGPRLEVVLREGHRPREEVLGMQAGQGSTLCGGQTAGWGFQEGFDLFNPTEALLEPGQFRVMGSGMVLGPDVGQLAAVWQPDWLPDLGGLHL